MSNELQPVPPAGHQSPFERIRRTNDAGMEFWSSRDFAQVLGYADYRNFEQVIQKAKTACFNSAHPIEDHFGEVTEMIETMPEELPVADSIKKLEAQQRKKLKQRKADEAT